MLRVFTSCLQAMGRPGQLSSGTPAYSPTTQALLGQGHQPHNGISPDEQVPQVGELTVCGILD